MEVLVLTRFTKFVGTLAVLAALVPLSAAQQTRVYREGNSWVQEITGTLPATRNLKVKIEVGAVRVQGGNESGISYVIRNRAYTSSEQQARRQFDAYKVSASTKGDWAWVAADWVGGSPKKFSGEFALNVPRQMDVVKVMTQGGSVVVKAIAGRVDAESGGGSITVDDIGGAVSGQTGGGSIDVGSAGGDLNLQTGGGSISIRQAQGKTNASSGGGSVVLINGLQGAILATGGGSIEVKKCGGAVKVSTGGGSVELGEIGGAAEVETGGGSIRVVSAKGPVRAETGGGSIELKGLTDGARAETAGGGIVAQFVSSRGSSKESVLRTTAGDIVVYLAADVAVDIRANIDLANGHNIKSDFPEIKVTATGGEWGPRSVSAEGALNGGGPVLKVRTTTGDIVFRRSNR